jgi:hypothetical protein
MLSIVIIVFLLERVHPQTTCVGNVCHVAPLYFTPTSLSHDQGTEKQGKWDISLELKNQQGSV